MGQSGTSIKLKEHACMYVLFVYTTESNLFYWILIEYISETVTWCPTVYTIFRQYYVARGIDDTCYAYAYV